jgi:hypothetical protein
MTTIKDIEFNGLKKKEIRDYILKYAKQAKSFLDLYGNGEMYRIAKKNRVNILSIDDGRDFNNGDKLKKELVGKDKMFISIRNLCKTSTRKHNVIWLDYCGPLSPTVWKDLTVLPAIMEKRGKLFVTYREGRENMLPKGTMREVINKVYGEITMTVLKEAGLEVKQIGKEVYISNPQYDTRKKKSGDKMVTIELNWKKI